MAGSAQAAQPLDTRWPGQGREPICRFARFVPAYWRAGAPVDGARFKFRPCPYYDSEAPVAGAGLPEAEEPVADEALEEVTPPPLEVR